MLQYGGANKHYVTKNCNNNDNTILIKIINYLFRTNKHRDMDKNLKLNLKHENPSIL